MLWPLAPYRNFHGVVHPQTSSETFGSCLVADASAAATSIACETGTPRIDDEQSTSSQTRYLPSLCAVRRSNSRKSPDATRGSDRLSSRPVRRSRCFAKLPVRERAKAARIAAPAPVGRPVYFDFDRASPSGDQ